MMNGKGFGLLKKRHWAFAGLVSAILLVILIGRKNNSTDGEKPSASGHAGSIKANNSMSSSSSHSSTEGNVFFTKRIAVVNLSDHKVANEVARALAEGLRSQSYIESVDFFQGDKHPADGQRLYDLYISLEMPEFRSKGFLLTGREVEAKIKVTVGNDFWNSRHSYHDELSSPSINWFMDATLDHQSVARGVEMPGNPYRQVTANISTQICDSVTKSLSDLSAKFGNPASMPDGLVPEFQPTPSLPLPKSEVLYQMISGYGFMLNNYTVWTMETTETREVLEELLDGLKADGWRTGSPDFEENASQYYFRATKENLVLEAFEARGFEPRTDDERIRLVFRYSDRMSKEQLRKVLAPVVQAEPVPIDTWQAFSRVMTKEQNDLVIQKILNRSDLPVSAELRVVRYLNRNDRKDEAVERLNKAAFLSRLDNSVDDGQIRKLGKEITGSKDWKPVEPTVEDLERFGIRKAVSGESVEVEVGLDQPVLLYVETDERICVCSVKIERAKIPAAIFSIQTSNCKIPDRGRSSSGSTPHTTSRPWKASTGSHMGDIYWNISAEEIEGERFLLKLTNNAS